MQILAFFCILFMSPFITFSHEYYILKCIVKIDLVSGESVTLFVTSHSSHAKLIRTVKDGKKRKQVKKERRNKKALSDDCSKKASGVYPS